MYYKSIKFHRKLPKCVLLEWLSKSVACVYVGMANILFGSIFLQVFVKVDTVSCFICGVHGSFDFKVKKAHCWL